MRVERKLVTVDALSGNGEDLGFQTNVLMLEWGIEIVLISHGDKNVYRCVPGPSVICCLSTLRPLGCACFIVNNGVELRTAVTP